ncbi:MAG: UDP-3-O-(3-hydroxymyristoyl)glucosamine N-acyltransferase [Candidatus Competibacteraceae bacterium]|jgi:UDP-3-O-[3-hydroxymyristoyl] glucosamine N-acyltransferase|nr:UDP-3-O-(3-hydroxymyristoyl)glucosamine N-acyltransferase [Candidatus Competibacteraceae bacterium]
MRTLGEIAETVGVPLRGGDVATPVTGVATLQSAKPGQISFLINPRYRQYLSNTQASAVILSQRDADSCCVPMLVTDNPHVVYAHVAALFAPAPPTTRGIHPTACVSPTAQIADATWIGPHSVVEAGAVLEEGVIVGPHCVVGEFAVLGSNTRLVASVTVCHGVRLGQRVLVHPGAVIGSDGFGLANDHGQWVKIPQLGGVQVGDDVEIGANTTVDRGTLEDTIIEQGVKLDNQIQIAHNVRIGAHSALAGCVGIAGSARIGRHCVLGGGVGVAGHLDIADHVQITGMSLVTDSLTEAGVYSSSLPVQPHRRWNKISARLRQLDGLARRLFALENKCFSDDPTKRR